MRGEWHPQKCGTHLNYHLSCEQYEHLVRRSDNSCDLCRRRPRYGTFYIDHDHSLGQRAVRGRVCGSCNTNLGKIEAGSRLADDVTLAYLARAWHLEAGIETYDCPDDCRLAHHRPCLDAPKADMDDAL